MNDIEFRPIEKRDLNEVFFLLQQLTKINYEDRDIDYCWDKFTLNNSSNSVVGLYNNKVIAYGSIIIENKIRGEVSGHIEDIVVDKNMRNKNIGLSLINELVKIGNKKGCYRITLLCKEHLIKFYEKNDFIIDGVAMKKFII